MGVQKIANYFHSNDGDPIPEAPLVFSRCNLCGMVQLKHAVDTDLMYRKYWYTSNMNDTMRKHLMDDALVLMSKCELSHGDQIIDIGCNDGTFLSYFPSHCSKIGVDPSNIVPQKCTHVHDYFSFENVKKYLSPQKAKIVSSIAMFYDLNSPSSFVSDVRRCLKDDGIWILELSYLPRMIENTAYDSICHEHVAYYSLKTLMILLENTDMKIVKLDFNDINGGSFRLLIQPNGNEDIEVQGVLAKENSVGYGTMAPFVSFNNKVEESKRLTKHFFSQCVSNRKTVYGYGASTKGQVIMQYCCIKDLVAIAERNKLKHGLHTPGTNVKICSEEEMRLSNPDFLFIFPWYFIDEFTIREQEIMKNGTKLVVPLPKFSII